MQQPTSLKDLTPDAREIRAHFLDLVEDVRPDLYRYCRSLTRDLWDAEDLVQEALLRAFGRLATRSRLGGVAKPRPYLFRIATHAWIDRERRAGLLGEREDEETLAAPQETPPLEVREALERLVVALPPRERAAVLLKDVFDLSLAETAVALGTSVGGVKAALHRGRTKLRDARPERGERRRIRRGVVGDALLDAFVDAFNARDLDRLIGLFAEEATAEIVGCLHEDDPKAIRDGSLQHTLFGPEGEPLPAGDPEAEVVEVEGETLVVLWYRIDEEGGPGRALRDVVRLETDGERFVRMRYWYFSPEVLREVGEMLGEPARDNGYRYGG
jgi:RNA polymerase sigma-70 factor (ECF subfamily)